MVDTDFCLDLMRVTRAHHARALAKLEELEASGAQLYLPAPSRFELLAGAGLYIDQNGERRRVARVVEKFPTYPLDAASSDRAGNVLALLRREGRPIGIVDALIAGIALERGEAVLTRNLRHFGRVPGLRVETY